MRYVEGLIFQFPTVGVAEWIFRASSIYDPSVTGVGHQPLGYDQWSAFYGQYLVVGSKIHVAFTQRASTSAEPFIAAVELTNDGSSSAIPILQRVERPFVSYRNINGYGAIGAPPSVTKTYSLTKWFGRGDSIDAWDDLGADFGANPVEEAFYRVSVGDNQNASQATIFEATVTIDYLVVCSEPHVLPPS